MKVLGIDYGTKRIGLAAADTNVPVAVLRDVLENDASVFQRIARHCEKEAIEKVVVGLPFTLRGEEGAMVNAARAFGEKIRQTTSLPIEFIDERLTSKISTSDAGAAAAILQMWLDRQRHES